LNQIQSDKRKMIDFICERIRPDTPTRIVLADGADGPLWVDLDPVWDEDGGCELFIETNEPDAVGLREVYEYFRRKEMTFWEWEREIANGINRWKIRDLEREVGRLRATNMASTSSPTRVPMQTDRKSTLTVSETAALLGCSYGEARKRMLDGRIQAIKDGRWLRTRPEWVEEYVSKNMIKPSQTPGENHAIPVPSRKRKTHAKVKVRGIGYRFLKNRVK
jgi:excisionase family DNA binding protein